MVSDAPIAKIDHARRLLAEARSVDEVKQIVDLGEQLRLYALLSEHPEAATVREACELAGITVEEFLAS